MVISSLIYINPLQMKLKLLYFVVFGW